jgi:hypothetical protein
MPDTPTGPAELEPIILVVSDGKRFTLNTELTRLF